MAQPPAGSYGRAAMIGVLMALGLTICAAVFVFVSRYGPEATSLDAALNDPAAEAQRLRRLSGLLIILLISALLVLLFVIGSYLVIRIGRIVRTPISGRPTPYVDAWSSYRVTDEQIAAATSEYPPDSRRKRSDHPNQEPPADPDDEPPTSQR